jgi:hypothetical protein
MQNKQLKSSKKLCENAANFKCLETTLASENHMHEWMGKIHSPEISVRNQPTLCNIPEDRIYINDEITITHSRTHTHIYIAICMKISLVL